MGLIPVFDRSGRDNTGHALESAVVLELYRRGAELAYVRTANGFEVDFLARFPDGRQQLIRVCTSLYSEDTLAREIRALEDARSEHPRAEQVLIAMEMPPVLKLPKGIRVVPASEWLLTAT